MPIRVNFDVAADMTSVFQLFFLSTYSKCQSMISLHMHSKSWHNVICAPRSLSKSQNKLWCLGFNDPLCT